MQLVGSSGLPLCMNITTIITTLAITLKLWRLLAVLFLNIDQKLVRIGFPIVPILANFLHGRPDKTDREHKDKRSNSRDGWQGRDGRHKLQHSSNQEIDIG